MPDNTNDYMDEQQIYFEDMQRLGEYLDAAENKIGGLFAEAETTMDADDARQIDVDRMELKEEEDYIKEKLEDGHYIDGYAVVEIHKKYEKYIGQLKKEQENEKDPAKVDKIKDDIEKLKESRNRDLQRICDEAPKYSRSAIRSMMTQQLRANDAGRAGGEIKIYRKEEGQDGLLVTTYGKNRVGEINKMVRKHDERVAELKGRKADEQKRNLGHSTREFLQGDAEHMFKGSVAMSLHAALFLLNKLSQAGNKSAQWALYLYAVNKLTMDDAAAIQKAIDDTSKESIGKGSNRDMEEQKGWNGTIEPMDFNSPDLPPFEDMDKCETYDAEHDVMSVGASYIDTAGTMRQGSIYLGSEENIRQFLGNAGVTDVDAEIAENAEKVEALGIDNLMVDNVQDAYENAAKKTEEDVEEAWEDECEEELEEAAEVAEEEATKTVLPRSEENVSDILGENPDEEIGGKTADAQKTRNNVDTDVRAWMAANNDSRNIVDDAPDKSDGGEPPSIAEELGGDDMSLG